MDTASWNKLLTPDLFEKIAAGKSNRRFYPLFSQREAWEKLGTGTFKQALKEEVLKEAEVILSQPMEALSAYDYFRFVTEGNRALYEKRYFKRRNDFGTLFLALCLTGNKEKYFPAVVDHLAALTAEPFWCAPAHVVRDADPMPMPGNAERVDLFSSETAVQVALALQILHEELTAFSPRFLESCKKAVLEKVVCPVREKYDTDDPFIHKWIHNNANWAPWCAGNVLCAAALLLEDPQQLADLARKMNSTCAGFYENVPEDGYCTEGPSYWRKAAVSLFAYCQVLENMVPGSVDGVWHDLKFRRMGEFGALMVINGRDQVLCGDAGHVADCGIDAAQIYEYGVKVHSDVLQRFSVNRLTPNPHLRKFTKVEESVSRFGTGNRLESLLHAFFALPDDSGAIPECQLPEVSQWENMVIFRHADGFSASLKTGHNGEPHNHNDMGHFTIYDRDRPLVIDLGTGMYSRKNFSSERYQLYYTNAFGHNALRFGEHIQPGGADFRAMLSLPEPGTATADLREAYPAETRLKRYTRTLHCTKESVCIMDRWEQEIPEKANFTLYSPQQVKLLPDGSLDFGNGVLCTMTGARCRTVEVLAVQDIPRHWGDHLLRLEFEAENGEFSLTFQYSK